MYFARSLPPRSTPRTLSVLLALLILCLLLAAFCFHTHLVAYLTSMWHFGLQTAMMWHYGSQTAMQWHYSHLTTMSQYFGSSLLHSITIQWHIGPQMAIPQTAMHWRGDSSMMWRG